MTSFFGWVDFSESEREQMHNVIKLFEQQDTRDELGLGSIRDGFGNLLFPGTSTIQTRIKYMLFVSWLYRELERQKVPSSEIAGKMRRKEIELIYALIKSEDTQGIIGKDAREKLQRLPSSVYWSGMYAWGIRLFEGSQDQYCRSLDTFYKKQKERLVSEDKEYTDRSFMYNWHPGLPPYPKKFPQGVSFELSTSEAEYLQEQIIRYCSGSLLSFLVTDTSPVSTEIQFVWDHPEFDRFSETHKIQVRHARNFSKIMHGAALFYNYLLAQKANIPEWEEDYRTAVQNWAVEINGMLDNLRQWDLVEFWETVKLGNTTIPYATRTFVGEWIDYCIRREGLSNILDSSTTAAMITDRERYLKRSRARLTNQQALNNWTGEAGTSQLAYRWQIIRGMVNDLLKGLGKNEVKNIVES